MYDNGNKRSKNPFFFERCGNKYLHLPIRITAEYDRLSDMSACLLEDSFAHGDYRGLMCKKYCRQPLLTL